MKIRLLGKALFSKQLRKDLLSSFGIIRKRGGKSK